MAAQLDPSEMTLLQALAARYPTADLALAEAASLRASLLLPKGTVHVVSDVHGEYKKLRHIITTPPALCARSSSLCSQTRCRRTRFRNSSRPSTTRTRRSSTGVPPSQTRRCAASG